VLTPDQISQVGGAVEASAARTVDALVSLVSSRVARAVMDGDLARALVESGRLPQIVLSALGADPLLAASWAARTGGAALASSLASDAAAIGVPAERVADLAGGALPALVGNVREWQVRANLSMADDARQSYYGIVSDLLPRVARSEMGREEAVAEGVRRMSERGVCVVRQGSGRRDRPEVALRRHVETQIKHAAADATTEACHRLGVRLVEVDSHVGARPTHREWQGRVYGLDGPCEVGGVRYPGLAASGAEAGMREPNCRHSMAPYAPGRARRWSETPDEDAGLDPDAYYKATQRQRANERKIRESKREAQALRDAGADDTPARLRLGRAQADQRALLKESPTLARRLERERAYTEKGKLIDVRGLDRQATSRTALLARQGTRKAISDAGVSSSRVSEILRTSSPNIGTMTASDRERSLSRAISQAHAERERDARLAGPLPNTVRASAQRKHVPGTPEYERKAEQVRRAGTYPAPSALTVGEGDVQGLVNELAGTGKVRTTHSGQWSGREVCDAGRPIGYIVTEDGTRVPTSSFTIHYSKSGVHIVPARPEGGQS
jgi:hypothetical protein